MVRAGKRKEDSGGERSRGGRGGPPDRRQVAGGVDGVRRQPVDLGLVEEEEERSEASYAVVRIVSVEARLRDACLDEPLVALTRPRDQLVERTELDGVGRACLRARRLEAVLKAVVA